MQRSKPRLSQRKDDTMTTPVSPSPTAQASSFDLAERFPNIVSAETRPSFKGWIIAKENLVEVATALRDEFGYDLLSSVTGVDYFPENKMEVVYHEIGRASCRERV